MHLKNEQETREAIENWRSASLTVQLSNLRNALESLELDQIHYEQKEHGRGIERCELCLALLQRRIIELENS
ncbi:MAG: hypothetical protein KAS94_00760 [Desulfobulbaceae bacterium]|nr:hypothetical protein [Desulfobulbaceae bacterium]